MALDYGDEEVTPALATPTTLASSTVDEEQENAVESRSVFTGQLSQTCTHPLQHEWTLWYDSPQKKTATQLTWAENLKHVYTFSTVEDFWGVYNNIVKASQLQTGANYHLFKKGIRPEWEDPENRRGGKWVVNLARSDPSFDNYWLFTALACIGEMFEHSIDIAGCVVSLRAKQNRIALWTNSAEPPALCMSVGTQFKQILGVPRGTSIGYQIHDSAMQSNSSYRNKDVYTV